MRKVEATSLFYWIAIFSIAALLSSCKKDKVEPDARTLQLEKLTTTWKVKTVVNDDEDVTDLYAGFRLIINQLNYTTENGGNAWPSSGAYDFKGTDLSTLIRSDNTEIHIDEVTASTLILSFNFNTLSSGRTKGVTGDFTFSLIK
ncbi:MAG: hypothetical protein KDC93_06665 [Cyclobacteriaceae bacterium]|jgi:hypothetical protein|nr:hypothetical protein [Cyclobacteriaceae bacterium]